MLTPAFLLSCSEVARRVIKELGKKFDEDMAPDELTDGMTLQLTTMLKSVQIFKPPDGSCLSPAGEYNLRLGIMKELNPEVRPEPLTP